MAGKLGSFVQIFGHRLAPILTAWRNGIEGAESRGCRSGGGALWEAAARRDAAGDWVRSFRGGAEADDVSGCMTESYGWFAAMKLGSFVQIARHWFTPILTKI